MSIGKYIFLSHQWLDKQKPTCPFPLYFIFFQQHSLFLFPSVLTPSLSFPLISSPLSPCWSQVGVACVLLWLQQEDYLMCRCAKKDQGVWCWKESLCCICRSPYTTTSSFRPNPHRQRCVPRQGQTEGFSPPRASAQDPIHPLLNAPPCFSSTNLRTASF